MSSALAIPSAIPETLEIWSSEPLRVVRLGLKRYKVVGFEIMFDLCPAGAKSETANVAGHDPYKLITKNREIVLQGENACTLSDVLWLILHRLNVEKRHALTIGELCDPNGNEEAVWEIGYAPQTHTIRNYVSRINTELAKAGIIATVRFSEKTNELTLILPTNEERIDHESDTDIEQGNDSEAQTEPSGRGKQKKAAKRNADA